MFIDVIMWFVYKQGEGLYFMQNSRATTLYSKVIYPYPRYRTWRIHLYFDFVYLQIIHNSGS